MIFVKDFELYNGLFINGHCKTLYNVQPDHPIILNYFISVSVLPTIHVSPIYIDLALFLRIFPYICINSVLLSSFKFLFYSFS